MGSRETGSHRLAGKRVTVMGLGVLGGGTGVARYLAERGAVVTVTDMRDVGMLAESIEQLQGLPITFHLGGHDPKDFQATGADVVVRNPGVRPDSPYLQMARADGLPVEMEMTLFFRDCPAPIVGVTGTKGKTTVSTLCAAILREWKPDTLLAGNMGISALAQLDVISERIPVVIELSSFQLEALDEHRLSPQIAVFTNVSEDHLDRYTSFAEYVAVKRTIAHHQSGDDVVVYNIDDPEVRPIAGEARGKLMPFGLNDPGRDGAWLSSDELVWRWNSAERRWQCPEQLALAGDHGTLNALAAMAAALMAGAPEDAVERGLRGFQGVPNRLENVATVDGVTYLNDTSATAPAAAVAALNVLSHRFQRVHLIAGGADKQSDLRPFADAIERYRPRVLLLDGTATPILMALLRVRNVPFDGPFRSMEAVVDAAASEARPGDCVTLSPGCASFGMFRNEFERGEHFRAAVQRLLTGAGVQNQQQG